MRFISYINGCCCRTHTDLKRDYFYVWHSSTGIIERLEVTDSVDWPSLVTPGTKYGGLFTDYVGKGDYALVIENSQADTLTFVDDKLQDINCNVYNGNVYSASCRFVKNKGYTSIQVPIKNTIYYMCEVRSEYFTNHVVFSYDEINPSMIPVSPIDSSVYKSNAGYYKISGQSNETEATTKVANSLSIIQRGGGTTTTVTAITLEPSLVRGYITISTIPNILANTYYEVRQEITTVDGYIVNIPTSYVYTGDLSEDDIVISSKPIPNVNYLSFTAKEPSSVTLQDFRNKNTAYTMYYSRDLEAWNKLDSSTIVNLNTNDYIYLKGTGAVSTKTNTGSQFVMTGAIEAHGNIMSLCYGDEAEDKTTIPGNYCFYRLFKNCVSLITAPRLPATTLAQSCYGEIFRDCTNLVSAPKLPATVLTTSCYSGMFQNCTSLQVAPQLPATTLVQSCYSRMFYDCTSLENSPTLPATTLALFCYDNMVGNTNVIPDCSNIDFTSQEVVASGGLQGLFARTKVTDEDLNNILPKNSDGKYCLPVITLANNCYSSMFSNCINLKTAPVLPATTLVSGCYNLMFNNCSNLSYIKALFTAIQGQSVGYISNWVSNVSPTGTFVKNSAATWDATGDSGIPEGWTVETADV